MAHEAYTFWTGTRNRGRPKDQRLDIDVSHDALKMAAYVKIVCGAKLSLFLMQRMVDVIYSILKSYDSNIHLKNLPILLMCEFIDDGASIFPLAMLQPCMVDSWEVWADDFKPFHNRPYGNNPVGLV
jgi:hypothetical protein